MYQRKPPRVGAPLHTREVFPEVSRSGERIDEKLPGTATSRHRQFPSIQFFFFFFFRFHSRIVGNSAHRKAAGEASLERLVNYSS